MMSPLRLVFTALLLIIFVNANASQAELESRNKFTITAFNIRFYGLHGIAAGEGEATPPVIKEESRDPYLRKFLKESIPSSDFFVFEEIVDVPRLKSLLPSGWDCISYENPSPTHQHVVLCHSPKYAFEKEPTDNNFLIDEVSGEKGTLRPAVTAIVTDLKGNKLFRLVGVHLKASPTYSTTRVAQAKIISDYLEKLKSSNLPVVITGDFNTYSMTTNGETEDDTKLILKAFNERALDMKRIPNDLFTFRSSYGYSGHFDHFYMSNSLTATKPLKIYEVCNAEITNEELVNYNTNISDHCPVTAEIAL